MKSRKMNRIGVGLLLGILLSLTSCGESHELTIENRSQYDVYAYIALELKPYGTLYPDTILPSGDEFDAKNRLHKIKKGDRYMANGFVDWIDFYDEIGVDTISFYFFRAKAIETYPWREVAERNMVLQRMDVSKADMMVWKKKVVLYKVPE